MKNITVPVPTDTYYRAHMWTGKHHDFLSRNIAKTL